MDTQVLDDLSELLETVLDGEALASMRRKVCNNYFYSDSTVVASTTGAVERLVADHGRDAALVQGWQAIVIDADEFQTVRQTDPLRVKLTFAVDDEELDVTLGEQLQVTSSERSARRLAGRVRHPVQRSSPVGFSPPVCEAGF